MTHHRLSRHDIKRDEVLEGLSRTVDFGRRNARRLAWVGIGALVALVATLGATTWRGHRQGAADRALAAALEGGGPDSAARDAEALRGVAERYRGSDAAAIANALLGEEAARAGDLEEARRRWTAFLDAAPESMLAGAVRRNLLELDRAQGRGEGVAAELRGMLESRRAPLPRDLALYELGRTLEQVGKPEEALEAYDRLLAEHPDSVYAGEARRRAASLGAS